MKRRGFTLLEMLICGLLISCVILGVVGLFAGCARAYRHSDHQEQAGRLVEETLEQARSQPFSQLRLGRTTLADQTYDEIVYQAEEEVLAEASVSPQFLKRIRVTVYWTYCNHRQQLIRESWLSAIKT